MTDDLEHGLGALPSPPDPRDLPISQLYTLTGAAELLALPSAFRAASPYPPVLNQGSSPMCVAFSSSTLKAYEDLRDQGLYNFDEPTFFRQIGGTDQGAVIRDAFARLLNVGYPVAGSGNAQLHRIAAYYAVPVTRSGICAAVAAFGPILIGMTWFNSWFRPVYGVLPAPSGGIAGGHAIVCVGWESRGLRLRNSWGSGWASGGEVILPWAYLTHVREAWKAIDRIESTPLRRLINRVLFLRRHEPGAAGRWEKAHPTPASETTAQRTTRLTAEAVYLTKARIRRLVVEVTALRHRRPIAARVYRRAHPLPPAGTETLRQRDDRLTAEVIALRKAIH